ncbi:MAG: DUF4124 domain-containing protein [Gammaproteobacteria bacterium]
MPVPHLSTETDTMKTTLTQLLSVSLLTLASLSASADSDVYKWTDSSGRVHYSDKPDGDNLEKMNVKSKRTDNAAIVKAKQVRIDVAQAAAADARIQANLDQEEEQNQAIRDENCSRASEALASLRNAQRLYIPGENGDRRYLSEEEIADRIQRAEKDTSKWCAKK